MYKTSKPSERLETIIFKAAMHSYYLRCSFRCFISSLADSIRSPNCFSTLLLIKCLFLIIVSWVLSINCSQYAKRSSSGSKLMTFLYTKSISFKGSTHTLYLTSRCFKRGRTTTEKIRITNQTLTFAVARPSFIICDFIS